MLKLIAEDFIDPDKIDLVLPLYEELVEKTGKNRDVLAMSFAKIEKIRDILSL